MPDIVDTMPWSESIGANGQVFIFDNQGREVPLFTMTNFVVACSKKLAATRTATPAEPAPEI